MTYNEIVAKVSEELGIPKSRVDRIYRSYWKTIRNYIEALPLKDDLTDEEFLALKTSVNVPSIGKLYISLPRYRRIKEKYSTYLKKKSNAENKENQADIYNSDNDSHQV